MKSLVLFTLLAGGSAETNNANAPKAAVAPCDSNEAKVVKDVLKAPATPPKAAAANAGTPPDAAKQNAVNGLAQLGILPADKVKAENADANKPKIGALPEQETCK